MSYVNYRTKDLRITVQLKRPNKKVINLLEGFSKLNCSSIRFENSKISRLMAK
jgi:hypothetical protein